MRTGLAWALYAGLVIVQVASQVAGSALWAGVSQAFLAPTLIAIVLLSKLRRGRLRSWALAALGFSFVGDMLPKVVPKEFEMHALIGGFLLAQVCWIIGLWPLRHRARPIKARWQIPIYLLFGALIVGLSLPGAGAALAPAVVIYAAVIIAMAVLASSLGRIGQLGGIVFIVSDAMIALSRFAPWLHIPYEGAAIMLTYATGLGLLTLATVRFLRQST